MIEIAKVIESIANTSGSNGKLSILKNNENLPGLKSILKFIYNPYCRTGISTKKLDKAMSYLASVGSTTYEEAIEYFKLHTTGSDADLAFARDFISSTPEECRWLAKAIVTQDLKIGVTATSLNKVYGKDFIPKIGCMLGTSYGDVGTQKTKWPCIVTEKLDGIRRIIVKEDGNVKAYSRSGHEDTGIVEILEEVAKFLPNNTVFDGELLAKGDFVDSIALRQATNSIANSGGVKTGLTFNVFDMVPLDEFKEGASKQNALARKITLAAIMGDVEGVKILAPDKWWEISQAFGMHGVTLEHVKVVPILGLVSSIKEVEPIVAPIWQRGYEGVMLNTVSGLYEIKRSKQLLKIKHTEEHVLTVVDMIEGTGKFEDMLGALVVDYKGRRLGVGSGFTDDQRKMLWDNYSTYVGAQIEVETFGESTNALGEVSLNCPIFKRFVGEEE